MHAQIELPKACSVREEHDGSPDRMAGSTSPGKGHAYPDTPSTNPTR